VSGKKGQKSKKATEIPDRFSQQFLETMDSRLAVVRELRQKFKNYCQDLGGEAELSWKQKGLTKRLLHVEGLCESKEASLVKGEAIDEVKYLNEVETYRRLCTTLGIKKHPRLVGTLAEQYARREDAQS
jgi:hypothetical protein